jgi:hypothetical protein
MTDGKVGNFAGPIDIVGREGSKDLSTLLSALLQAADRTGRFLDIMK